MKLTDLTQKLPAELLKLIEFIDDYGFEVAIIGGWVRDYFLGTTLSNDFDIELRPQDELCDFMSLYESLVEVLENSYQVEHLAYNVTKIRLPRCEVELTLPRVEDYSDEIHHSNFEATYIADVDYTQGFKRRDFTINAMCLVYARDCFNLIDPLSGYQHLQQKRLVACSEDFKHDPVRYLRGIRFSLKLGFELELALVQEMKQFKLNQFSPHYLKLEAMKSQRPLSFFKDFFGYRGKEFFLDELALAFEAKFFQFSFEEFFRNIIFLNQHLLDLINEAARIFLKQPEFNDYHYQKYLGQKYEYGVELSEAVRSFRHLSKLNPEVIDFYFDNKLTDISSEKLQQIEKTKIDLTHIEPSQRSEYDFYFKLKGVYGN